MAVRRKVNGLLNRLSESSKDSIARSLKSTLEANSSAVVSHCIKDCLLQTCANPTQTMSTLIPLYAAVIASLHFTTARDIGPYIVEALAVKFYQVNYKTDIHCRMFYN